MTARRQRGAPFGVWVLRNETRARVYEHIRAVPGTRLRETMRAVSIGHGTLHHHVNTLERAGLVKRVRINERHVRLYATAQTCITCGQPVPRILGLEACTNE